MNDYDLELALTQLSSDQLSEMTKHLPANYTIEDRSNNGWGLVISANNNNKSLNEQINEFLSGLKTIKDRITPSRATLRVAYFNKNYTTTINLNKFEQLTDLNIELEISIYPTE